MIKRESRRAFKSRVDAAFCRLEQVCDHVSSQAARLLREATMAAEESEKVHRRFTRGSPPYKQSVSTAARYFVLHWYHAAEPTELVSWATASTIRADALYARGLRCELRKADRDPWPQSSAFEGDYVEDIAPCR